MKVIRKFLLLLIILGGWCAQAQKVSWTPDGTHYTIFRSGSLIKVDPRTEKETVMFPREAFIPSGASEPLKVQSFDYAPDGKSILLFANTAKVWRYHTRGDYWLMDLSSGKLRQIGLGLPSQSLMFAKFSPDARRIAYVSEHNIYAEDVSSGIKKQLTGDGTRKRINGTFDWAYEEEFFCRDGFRWSPDGSRIAYWQIDATNVRDFYMVNFTDSVYSSIIPVEYPKVGEKPSPARIGVVNVANSRTTWMRPEGDPADFYITRMEWSSNGELVMQQLDRKQQESKLMYANITDGVTRTFWAENDDAWVDLNTEDPRGWYWVNKGQDFLWISEKDGWRSIYKISRDGKTTTLLTKGDYDIDKLLAIDEPNNYVYFTASPKNPLQRYLYRVRINGGKDGAELVSSGNQKGTHGYNISPNARLAKHSFSSHNIFPVEEWITLPDGRPVSRDKSIARNMKVDESRNIEYIKISISNNLELDAWVYKPLNFDHTKKYPVVFYVYGGPGATTVNDVFGIHSNFLYPEIRKDGYVQVSLDCRGTPNLKGAPWRKAIYGKDGQLNIEDIATGAKKILELPYIDPSRAAIWGWSAGGSVTLHILFRYPQLFQTGISIAPITHLLHYDNIYTERFMGLPEENGEAYEKGSAVNYAKHLQGNLLLIHGTGDDNVHYSNSELLINELVRHNKLFTFMPYPNRSHNISEGSGTFMHLSSIFKNYLQKHCVPGAK